MAPLPGSVVLLREAPAAAAAATAPVPAAGRTATDESPLSSATALAVDSYRSVTSAASEPLFAAAGTDVQPAAAFASSSPRSHEHREKRKQADARRKREKRLKRPSILVDGVAVDVDVELLVEVVAGLGGIKVVRLMRLWDTVRTALGLPDGDEQYMVRANRTLSTLCAKILRADTDAGGAAGNGL